MSKGWVKLHRELQYHYLWMDKPFTKGQAWVDIILMVNHKNNKCVLGNELLEVERGSTITSIRKLCERWGWSKTKVVSFLNLLKSDNMINYFSDTKKTVLTIENYDLYQDIEDTEKTQKGHEEDTERTRKSTNKNDKNDKEINIVPFTEIVELYNRVCMSLPNVQKLTDSRKRKLTARWKEMPDIEQWKRLFNEVEQIPFLKGENDRGWKASFDWLIENDSNITKVLEGQYRREKNGAEEKPAWGWT